jgi:hypothetical protein
LTERYLILALVAGLFPGVASACSPGMEPWLIKVVVGDRPIRANPDCSFTHAGRTAFDVGEGSATEDLGKGRVSQIISFGEHACSINEYALVTDCRSQKALLIRGADNPDGGGTGVIHSVDIVVKPDGPISLREGRSISELADRARKRGFTVVSDVEAFVLALRKKNRFDPFCGCKVYYPEFAEASQ